MAVMSPALLAVLALLSPARAFSPEVHRAISARALALEAADPVEARRFPIAAADEDWNLVRKWGAWHHYGWDAPLLWRRPSGERVARVESALTAALAAGHRGRAWVLAGYAAHHVQDMASPPHVVPVAHGLADGFEDYDVAALIAAAGAEPPPALGPVDAHRTLAAATAGALAEPLACAEGPLPWTRFWAPREGRFGRRGDLRFGAVPGCEDGTLTFVRARIEAAVAYTRAIVRFVAGA